MSRLSDAIKEKKQKHPLMEGREKGDNANILNNEITIIDYDIINGKDGEYLLFITKEDDAHFYFGGTILTNDFKDFESKGLHDDVKAEGVRIKLHEQKNEKGNRTYIAVDYLDDGADDLPF